MDEERDLQTLVPTPHDQRHFVPAAQSEGPLVRLYEGTIKSSRTLSKPKRTQQQLDLFRAADHSRRGTRALPREMKCSTESKTSKKIRVLPGFRFPRIRSNPEMQKVKNWVYVASVDGQLAVSDSAAFSLMQSVFGEYNIEKQTYQNYPSEPPLLQTAPPVLSMERGATLAISVAGSGTNPSCSPVNGLLPTTAIPGLRDTDFASDRGNASTLNLDLDPGSNADRRARRIARLWETAKCTDAYIAIKTLLNTEDDRQAIAAALVAYHPNRLTSPTKLERYIFPYALERDPRRVE